MHFITCPEVLQHGCSHLVQEIKSKANKQTKEQLIEPLMYLQRRVCIHLKPGHHLGPGFKLLALRVDVVVKHAALGGELDGFELAHPPLAELHSVVEQLRSHRAHMQRHRGQAGGQYSEMTSSLLLLLLQWLWIHALIYTGVNTNQRTNKWQQYSDQLQQMKGGKSEVAAPSMIIYDQL